MAELHGTIVSGRWKGTRAALVERLIDPDFILVRPFNDTAESEDARIHLSPVHKIVIPSSAWKADET